MSERSPKYPSVPLKESLDAIERIYKEAGRSVISPEAAVKALGYAGMNGASRGFLAALNTYGLLARDKNGIKVSEDAIGAIRPMDEADRLVHLRRLALAPTLFTEIYTNNRDCSESVLATILLRKGFTEDGARRAAKVWKDNFEFARLSDPDYASANEVNKSVTTDAAGGKAKADDVMQPPQTPPAQAKTHPVGVIPIKDNQKMLAEYLIPLGSNEAKLVFTGEKLTLADFDDLVDFVQMFKKQYERKLKAEEAANYVKNIDALFSGGTKEPPPENYQIQ